MIFRILWASWAFGLTIQAFARDVSLAISLACFFALLEGYAIARSSRGDTWSEANWTFYADKPARIPLIVGFAFHTVAVFTNIAWQSQLLADISLGVLAAGILGWLIPHFISKGRLG